LKAKGREGRVRKSSTAAGQETKADLSRDSSCNKDQTEREEEPKGFWEPSGAIDTSGLRESVTGQGDGKFKAKKARESVALITILIANHRLKKKKTCHIAVQGGEPGC